MNHAPLAVKVGTHYHVEGFRQFHRDGSACHRMGCPQLHEAKRIWTEDFDNLVVTTGRNRLLAAVLKGTSVGGAAAGYHDGGRMPTKWIASTAYTLGDVVRPTNASGQIDNNRIFICQVAGTSNSSEPAWPSTAGATVTDNTATWQEASVYMVGLKGAGTIAAADTMASHAGWSEVTAYSQTARPNLVLGSVASGSVDNSGSVAVFSINGTATVAGAFVCNLANKLATGMLYGAGDFGTPRDVLSGDTLNVTVTASITSS
jgi:hypothetical protein